MPPREALEHISKISTFDRVARRAFGLDDKENDQQRPVIDVKVLSLEGESLVRELNEGRGEGAVEV